MCTGLEVEGQLQTAAAVASQVELASAALGSPVTWSGRDRALPRPGSTCWRAVVSSPGLSCLTDPRFSVLRVVALVFHCLVFSVKTKGRCFQHASYRATIALDAFEAVCAWLEADNQRQ